MNCVGRMFSDNLYGEIRRKSDKCQGMSTSNFQWRHDGLGCINDYVENQHFNTIIVANEKAIREQEANKLENSKKKLIDPIKWKRSLAFTPFDETVFRPPYERGN